MLSDIPLFSLHEFSIETFLKHILNKTAYSSDKKNPGIFNIFVQFLELKKLQKKILCDLTPLWQYSDGIRWQNI